MDSSSRRVAVLAGHLADQTCSSEAVSREVTAAAFHEQCFNFEPGKLLLNQVRASCAVRGVGSMTDWLDWHCTTSPRLQLRSLRSLLSLCHAPVPVPQLPPQVAIITGGGQGVGKAAAVLFAQHGAKVVVSDIDGSKAQATVDFIRQAAHMQLLPCAPPLRPCCRATAHCYSTADTTAFLLVVLQQQRGHGGQLSRCACVCVCTSLASSLAGGQKGSVCWTRLAAHLSAPLAAPQGT